MKSKIDYKEIIKLINLLEEKNLAEFELEVEGFRIKIARLVTPHHF
jgi:oxaloacetate decarboxylase alpha subunit/acetyl-CoA carboxylase biotin carboxyl carrier protein